MTFIHALTPSPHSASDEEKGAARENGVASDGGDIFTQSYLNAGGYFCQKRQNSRAIGIVISSVMTIISRRMTIDYVFYIWVIFPRTGKMSKN